MSHIFVLEDNKDLRNLYRTALELYGHNVILNESAEEAIECLDQLDFVPDVAVLDIAMEGLCGSAVVEYIRGNERTHAMPIIVVSCNGDFSYRLKKYDVKFAEKPIALSHLQSLVVQAIEEVRITASV